MLANVLPPATRLKITAWSLESHPVGQVRKPGARLDWPLLGRSALPEQPGWPASQGVKAPEERWVRMEGESVVPPPPRAGHWSENLAGGWGHCLQAWQQQDREGVRIETRGS